MFSNVFLAGKLTSKPSALARSVTTPVTRLLNIVAPSLPIAVPGGGGQGRRSGSLICPKSSQEPCKMAPTVGGLWGPGEVHFHLDVSSNWDYPG
jgi:hypothetical protein